MTRPSHPGGTTRQAGLSAQRVAGGLLIQVGCFLFFKNDLELVAAHISSYSALEFSVASPLEWGQGDGGLAGSPTAAGGSRSSPSTFEPGGGMSFPTLLADPHWLNPLETGRSVGGWG